MGSHQVRSAHMMARLRLSSTAEMPAHARGGIARAPWLTNMLGATLLICCDVWAILRLLCRKWMIGRCRTGAWPMRSVPTQAVEVFYSYAHKDEDLRNALVEHLSTLRREGYIREC